MKQYCIYSKESGTWPEIFDEYHLDTLRGDLEYLRTKRPHITFVVRERTVTDWVDIEDP